MATTSSSSLRYPVGTEAPNGAVQIQNLATDLDRKVVPAFTSASARNAAIPSPTKGQPCTVNGVFQVHDGTAWRFRIEGYASVSTNSSGAVSFAHNGGQTPRFWGMTPAGQATDQLNTIIAGMSSTADSTNIGFRFTRSDTNAYLANTLVVFYWWASF